MTKSNVKELLIYINKKANSSVDKSKLAEALPGLRYIPNENLAAMKEAIDVLPNGKCSINKIVDEMEYFGALDFKPYMIDDNDERVPVIVMSRNRFMLLCKYDYFLLSKTMDGSGEVCRSMGSLSVFLTTKGKEDYKSALLHLHALQISTMASSLKLPVLTSDAILASLIPSITWQSVGLTSLKEVIEKGYFRFGKWQADNDMLKGLQWACQMCDDEGNAYGTLAITKEYIHLDVAGDHLDRCLTIVKIPASAKADSVVRKVFVSDAATSMLVVAGICFKWGTKKPHPDRLTIQRIQSMDACKDIHDVWNNIMRLF